MTSVSGTHPSAYHVFPLTAAREIFAAGRLLSKAKLSVQSPTRRTTADVDRLLGFAHFVHLYMPSAKRGVTELPILRAQLLPGKRPPVPHAVLVFDTQSIDDEACTVCAWNIAVGRPNIPGVCRGGNWTRGTNAGRIAEIWDAFRASGPTLEQARGYWGEPKVPIIPGERLATSRRLLHRAKIPESLLHSSVALGAGLRVLSFSAADRRSLLRLFAAVKIEREVELVEFPGYELGYDPLGGTREELDTYLVGQRDDAPMIDFDARR